MNCEHARALMHEVLDGCDEGRAELDPHLADCPECDAVWHQLQQLDGTLRADTQCEVPADDREREIGRVLGRIESAQTRARVVRVWLRWAAAAAALVATFSLGLYIGRTAWPREVKTVVRVPVVREKVVRVEVPVIEERVVVKPVPVVRERVVYRDRGPEATPTAEEPGPPRPGSSAPLILVIDRSWWDEPPIDGQSEAPLFPVGTLH